VYIIEVSVSLRKGKQGSGWGGVATEGWNVGEWGLSELDIRTNFTNKRYRCVALLQVSWLRTSDGMEWKL
jgi:hypothetical protein